MQFNARRKNVHILNADMEKLIIECAAHNSLKKKQLEAISFFVQGHDVFVSLPTGYGKSATLGILPVVFRLEVLLDNLAAISVQLPVPPPVRRQSFPAHAAGSHPLAVALVSSELPPSPS